MMPQIEDRGQTASVTTPTRTGLRRWPRRDMAAMTSQRKPTTTQLHPHSTAENTCIQPFSVIGKTACTQMNSGGVRTGLCVYAYVCTYCVYLGNYVGHLHKSV